MDEVLELCRRVLGQASSAQQAAAQAHAEGRRGRVTKLAAAIKACRAVAAGASDEQPSTLPPDDQPSDSARPELAAAVARELSSASARLPEREREVLALRELLRLSYKQIARVMAIKPAAVPMLLAEARLRLQVQRRGMSADVGAACAEGERALRLLACRQDSEPVSAEDQEWLLEHMAQCEACERAHAAMLEASVCYRAWRPEEVPAPAVKAVEAVEEAVVVEAVEEAVVVEEVPGPVEPEEVRLPLNPRRFRVRLNPRRFRVRLNPRRFRLPLNPTRFRVRLNPRRFRLRLNPRRFPLPLNPRRFPLPLNPRRFPLPLNPRRFPLPLNPRRSRLPQNLRTPRCRSRRKF